MNSIHLNTSKYKKKRSDLFFELLSKRIAPNRYLLIQNPIYVGNVQI